VDGFRGCLQGTHKIELPSACHLCISGNRNYLKIFFKNLKKVLLGERSFKFPGPSCSGELEPGFTSGKL
jgi:hypothetical protein